MMNRFQALVIKLWRVRYDYSWRTVHSEWQMRYVPKEEWWYNPAITPEIRKKWSEITYSDISEPDGNQIVGRELCSEAQEILGEDTVKDGWN